MTVTSNSPIVRYNFTGAATYTFDFKIYQGSDIKCYHIDADTGTVSTLTYLTDYTITFDSEIDGGSCVVSYNDKTTGTLEIRRELQIVQEVEWVNNSALDMSILELSQDRLVMLLQQMQVTVDEGTTEVDWKGEWVSGTAYSIRDIVVSNTGNLYVCLVDHTANATIELDVALGYWKLLLNTALIASEAADTAVATIDERAIPAGGTTGQVLKKDSSTDYDVSWHDMVADGTITEAMLTSELQAKIGSGVPVGAEMLWYTDTPPVGWFAENGGEYLKTSWPSLWAVLDGFVEETDGAGGVGTTHFKMPNPRGRFIRIWDNGAGLDPDAASRTANGAGDTGDYNGTDQDEAFADHAHSVNQYVSGTVGGTYGYGSGGGAKVTTSGSNGGSETRPTNTNRMLIMKAVA